MCCVLQYNEAIWASQKWNPIKAIWGALALLWDSLAKISIILLPLGITLAGFLKDKTEGLGSSLIPLRAFIWWKILSFSIFPFFSNETIPAWEHMARPEQSCTAQPQQPQQFPSTWRTRSKPFSTLFLLPPWPRPSALIDTLQVALALSWAELSWSGSHQIQTAAKDSKEARGFFS